MARQKIEIKKTTVTIKPKSSSGSSFKKPSELNRSTRGNRTNYTIRKK